MKKLNKAYWEDKYRSDNLGWDIGHISPPLKDYIDQLQDKHIKILVPGAGNGHEVRYLFQQGFDTVYVVDIAKKPLTYIKEQLPDFPDERLIETDFFSFKETNFDLILEQTFFCALHPTLRDAYTDKMTHLLKKGGKLVGLFFNFPLTQAGPPFGGRKADYKTRFQNHFKIKLLEEAYNSIKPRAGSELFFIFEK
ncbi:MAG: methyltransferase domain-containing protein [Bacteroidota bacterium]